VRALDRLARERYARYAGSLHHLEPNVKETPGGLRDHQVVGWLAGLAGRAGEALAELDEPFRYLAGVRAALHLQSGRDNNVLTFDAQDAIAEQRGESAATFMRGYYRHARHVHRVAVRSLDAAESGSSGLLSRFRDWRGRLANAEFSVYAERAHFRVPGAIDAEPELVLRLFEFTARHGIPPSPEAERQIAAHLPVLRERFAFPRPAPLWPTLARILALPHATMALRGMHESGVLVAVFPELEAIDCLVIRDFYHRYTVDEHTLVGIEKLSALAAPDPFAGLAAETAEPELLLLALLFHDSGKGWPDAGHVDGSVRLAGAAMRRIGVPPRGRDTVLFLIRFHLHLSAALQTRDTSDPAIVRALAQEVETVERLKPLVLLTWADISAVNPGAMTPWRSAQFWQLYLAVYNELTRELAADRIAPAPATEHRAAFLEGFPTRYLRTHTEEEIAEHIDLAERSRSRGVTVDLRRLDAAWRLTLAAADRPGLFATTAGVLAAFGMNILRAEAFSNSRGMVLDTFDFADPLRSLELNPTETGRLKSMAERAIAGKADVRELLRGRPKPVLPSRKARIRASVSFPPATEAATLIEIVAQDRPGLLYDLACVIREYGASIEVVLVDTEAHRAIDVFYVARNGRKLPPEDERALGEALRRAC
jgi:[protein-PII] uridylyltransferase